MRTDVESVRAVVVTHIPSSGNFYTSVTLLANAAHVIWDLRTTCVVFHTVTHANEGPPLHTGAADSGHARKVPQLNKQGAPRGPWGGWAGSWAGLWQGLRLVMLPLSIEQRFTSRCRNPLDRCLSPTLF